MKTFVTTMLIAFILVGRSMAQNREATFVSFHAYNSIELELAVKIITDPAKAASRKLSAEQEVSLKFWSDQKHQRCDTTITPPPAPNQEGRSVLCWNCEKDNHFVMGQVHPSKPHALIVEPIKQNSRSAMTGAFDPKYLGLRNAHFYDMNLGEMPNFFLIDPRSSPEFDVKINHGTDGKQLEQTVSIHKKNKLSIRYIYRKGVIDRIETHNTTTSSDPYQKGTVFQIESYFPIQDGVLFPKKCKLTSYNDGQAIGSEEFEVQSLKLNQPISADVFTLKGMNLPNGTFVHSGKRKSDVRIMEKDSAIPVDLEALAKQKFSTEIPPTPVETPKSNRWLYAILSALFMVISVFILVRRKRS
jgi:hypothetical protein